METNGKRDKSSREFQCPRRLFSVTCVLLVAALYSCLRRWKFDVVNPRLPDASKSTWIPESPDLRRFLRYSPFTAADEKIPLSMVRVNNKPQHLVFC